MEDNWGVRTKQTDNPKRTMVLSTLNVGHMYGQMSFFLLHAQPLNFYLCHFGKGQARQARGVRGKERKGNGVKVVVFFSFFFFPSLQSFLDFLAHSDCLPRRENGPINEWEEGWIFEERDGFQWTIFSLGVTSHV